MSRDPLRASGRALPCLPPKLTPNLLREMVKAAGSLEEGIEQGGWCGYASDAVSKLLWENGIEHYGINAGCRIDTSHAYLALISDDPMWHLAIVDVTVRQFIDSPRASEGQKKIASHYPYSRLAPSIAIVPPGHPFYATMGYNPDWNVQTVMDPGWDDYEGTPPSPDWKPGPRARLWWQYAPEVFIDYDEIERGQRGSPCRG